MNWWRSQLPKSDKKSLSEQQRFSISASESFSIFLANVKFISGTFSYSTCLMYIDRSHKRFASVQESLPFIFVHASK